MFLGLDALIAKHEPKNVTRSTPAGFGSGCQDEKTSTILISVIVSWGLSGQEFKRVLPTIVNSSLDTLGNILDCVEGTNNVRWTGQRLKVHLHEGQSLKGSCPDDLRLNYLGGRGINSQTLLNEVPARIDPLGPENLFMVGVGPLNGNGVSCLFKMDCDISLLRWTDSIRRQRRW